MNPLFPRRTANSILGLSLERGRLEAVVLRRTNGSVELQHSLSAALSLPTLAGDPTLVGREIRQQLDQAGIRERRCVVCLPSTWVLSLQVRLPELPEADLQDLLQVEAERGFPVSPDALILAESRFRSPAGEPFATLLAIPRDTIARLEAVLTAAQLRPVSFCPSTTALPAPTEPGAPAELAFAGGGEALALRVWAGGGLVLLRTLEGIVEHDGAETQFQPEALLRELRITLGQLPDALRNAIRQVRVFGQDDLTEELFETLQPQLEGWGMTSERALAWKPADAPLCCPPTPRSPLPSASPSAGLPAVAPPSNSSHPGSVPGNAFPIGTHPGVWPEPASPPGPSPCSPPWPSSFSRSNCGDGKAAGRPSPPTSPNWSPPSSASASTARGSMTRSAPSPSFAD